LSADKIWILPSADGTAGQFLKTDGAGNLSFDSLSFSTPLAVIGNATAGSEIRLPEDTDNGSNYVALKAADSIASNLTLTLPSADGTSGQVLQTNGSGVLSFSSVPTEVKAWIAFNGTGTPAITGSFNVTSITDHGTGNYTINFTTAFSDANYCMTAAGDNNGNSQGTMVILDNATTAPATGSCRIMTRVPSASLASDGVRINCAFFR
jgi:hypothetical protein